MDPLIRRYLGYRRHVNYPYSPTSLSSLWKSSSNTLPLNPLLASSPILRKLYNSLPFAPNLSPPEFLPTKQMVFLERLRDQLPGHRLLISDFDALPDAVEGKNGPVVQTRYGGDMVPCETFLVKQGYFDIFFPTGAFCSHPLLRCSLRLILSTTRFRNAERDILGHYDHPGESTSFPRLLFCTTTIEPFGSFGIIRSHGDFGIQAPSCGCLLSRRVFASIR